MRYKNIVKGEFISRPNRFIANVKIDGDEIIMYDGSNCCIVTITGILKYEGDLDVEILEMSRAAGLNRYYVMSVDELRVIYLTK